MSDNKLDKLRKSFQKKSIITEMNEPTEWISTGNAALNYRLTERFDVGIPNRRSMLFWGESGTGKTYLTSNACKNAQDKGYKIIYLDSENSISEDYMEKVGIDLSSDMFIPVLVDTIEDATSAISDVFNTMDEDDKFILVIDSLGGLLSDKEMKEFEAADMKGDQGQLSKKLKLFCKNINKKVSQHDAFCIMVTHAYQNQEMYSSDKWICTGGKGFQFFPSFSVKLEKAKLKEGKEVLNGVKIKAEVTKTRFTAPFQKCELKVPYDTGIDFTDGMLDVLEDEKVVEKNGAWYTYYVGGEPVKFQASKFKDHYETIMEHVKQKNLLKEEHKEELEPEEVTE